MDLIPPLWNAYMTWEEHTVKCTVRIGTHNTAQSFGRLAKSFSACLWTKSLWIRHKLQSLNFQILLLILILLATYAFHSQSGLYSCLNVKELVVQSRREIWSLSYWNWLRKDNNLVHKRSLNHWSNGTNWLSCVLRIYLYFAFDCIFLSCHVCVS